MPKAPLTARVWRKRKQPRTKLLGAQIGGAAFWAAFFVSVGRQPKGIGKGQRFEQPLFRPITCTHSDVAEREVLFKRLQCVIVGRGEISGKFRS